MTPERAGLAQAILDKAQADAEAATAAGKLAHAKRLVADAEAGHEAALAGIEAARSAAADRLAAGGSGAGELRAARARAQDAEDDCEAAKIALSRITGDEEFGEPARQARHAAARVQAAIDAVIVAEMGPLLEEAGRLQVDLASRRLVLREIAEKMPWPTNAARQQIEFFLGRPPFAVAVTEPVEAWRRAVAALARDATVALPGVGGEVAPAHKGLRLAR